MKNFILAIVICLSGILFGYTLAQLECSKVTYPKQTYETLKKEFDSIQETSDSLQQRLDSLKRFKVYYEYVVHTRQVIHLINGKFDHVTFEDDTIPCDTIYVPINEPFRKP